MRRLMRVAAFVILIILFCAPLALANDGGTHIVIQGSVLLAFIAIFVAQSKNRSGFNWFIICLIFGLLGFIVLLFQDELKE